MPLFLNNFSRGGDIPKVIVILGQTATGKSSLAVEIAKKFSSEIISADSRQVYKGLDIGTGKITRKEMSGIPHYLLDVVNPKKQFTVAQYKKLAEKKITEIVAKNKVPILCGGTGFYIDAVTKGMVLPQVPPNKKLRKILEKLTAQQLFKILGKLDSARAENIDAKNKMRLIRAIEIAKALGKVPKIREIEPMYNFIKIGLYLPPEKLKEKIEHRVSKMFSKNNNGGLLNEIKRLRKAGVSLKRLKELGFEYNNPTPKKVTMETLKYAKRQMTWFKRDREIKWFSSTQYKNIEKYIKVKLLK
jgi:tRNA dimethylallyltransferase